MRSEAQFGSFYYLFSYQMADSFRSEGSIGLCFHRNIDLGWVFFFFFKLSYLVKM